MCRVGFYIAVAIMAVRVSPALADSSGTFVAVVPDATVILQIVGTPDGRLTGRFEAVTLKQDGAIDDNNAMVSGAARGETMVVTIQASGHAGIVASGSINGNSLHLSGGASPGSLELTMLRSDEEQFHAKVASLVERQRVQRQVKSASDFLTAVENFTTKQDRLSAKSAEIALKIDAEATCYSAITSQMQNGLREERGIPGGGQASVARSQISVSLSQMSIQTEQVHQGFITAHNNASVALAGLAKESEATRRRCETANDALAPCVRLVESSNVLSAKAIALQNAFNRAEGIWTEQRAIQTQILRQAEAAVR